MTERLTPLEEVRLRLLLRDVRTDNNWAVHGDDLDELSRLGEKSIDSLRAARAERDRLRAVVRETVAVLGLEHTDDSLHRFARGITTDDSARFDAAMRALCVAAEEG